MQARAHQRSSHPARTLPPALRRWHRSLRRASCRRQATGRNAATRYTVPPHGAFPQGKRKQLAARFEREAMTRGMNPHPFDEVGGGNELARSLGAMTRHVDLHFARLIACGIEEPQPRTALIDDA